MCPCNALSALRRVTRCATQCSRGASHEVEPVLPTFCNGSGWCTRLESYTLFYNVLDTFTRFYYVSHDFHKVLQSFRIFDEKQRKASYA